MSDNEPQAAPAPAPASAAPESPVAANVWAYGRHDRQVPLAGALVAVLPFLGFPSGWDTAFYFLLGVFIIALGIVVRRSTHTPPASSPKQESMFSESTPSSVENGTGI